MLNKTLHHGIRVFILIAFLCLFARPDGLQAQATDGSHFLFPHYVVSADENTAVAIFNPNERAADVTVTLRGYGGNIIAARSNPVSFAVPGLGMVVKAPAELFGAGAFDGSLEISSPAPGLVAYMRVSDPGLTFLDGGVAPEASFNMIFPVVPDITEGMAEIDLANPNIRDASVELKLWNFEGNLLGSALVRVPARGTYHNLAQWIFPSGTRFSGASHITAVSKPRNVLSPAQTVSGTSLFTGFNAYGGPGDWAVFNALPTMRAATSGAIPYFHSGNNYIASLALVNVETSQASITITAIANNGSTLASRSVTLKGGGGLRAPLQDIMAELRNQERQGWLFIQSSGRILGGLLYGASDSGALSALPIQSFPRAEFVCPQIVQRSGLHTEISLVNPAPYAIPVDLEVVGDNGATLAAAQVIVGPAMRASLPLKEIVPEVDDLQAGVLHVRASGVVFATTSIWSDEGGVVSDLSPQSASFQPIPLASFVASGKVLLNGEPTAGFRVVLSGEVDRAVITDENGSYLFTGLLPGKYTLAVDQFGFMFSPAEASFEIADASQRQDFQGSTSVDAILVRPAALPVGSPDTAAVVFGLNFNPSSEAFIDRIRLDTTYISPTQLIVLIPEFLMRTAANHQVFVSTAEADGTVRQSENFPFLAYVRQPLLSTITPAGMIVEGGPDGILTIQGAGFLQGLKVKINGESEGIVTDILSDTQVLAYVPARYFEQGGIYPITVENVYPAMSESNVQLLPVYFPAPAIESILPDSCPVRLEEGTEALTLTVSGYGFRRGALVWLDSTPLVTTYCETDAYCLSTRIYAKVPSELLRKAGFAQIQVRNPNPSLENQEVAYLRIEGLKPTITSVLPGSATLANSEFDYQMPIVVEGTNLGPETAARIWKADAEPPDFSAEGVEIVSSTQMIVWIDISYPFALGDWYVQVANPAPGGGSSDPAAFSLSDANLVQNPFLTSISPQTVAAGGAAFTLVVNGVNFESGTTVYLKNSPLVTTLVSGNQVSASVPASLIRSAGRVPIFVVNSDTGGASNRLFMDIR